MNGNSDVLVSVTPSELLSNVNTAITLRARGAVAGLTTFRPLSSSRSLSPGLAWSPHHSRMRETVTMVWLGPLSMNGASPGAVSNRTKWSLCSNGSG